VGGPTTIFGRLHAVEVIGNRRIVREGGNFGGDDGGHVGEFFFCFVLLCFCFCFCLFVLYSILFSKSFKRCEVSKKE
jgi:hypothetical protein